MCFSTLFLLGYLKHVKHRLLFAYSSLLLLGIGYKHFQDKNNEHLN